MTIKISNQSNNVSANAVKSNVKSTPKDQSDTMQLKVKIDGKWIEQTYSDTALAFAIDNGLPFEIVRNGKPLRYNVREIKPSVQRVSKYDFKVGSVGYVNAGKYNLHYGKRKSKLDHRFENIFGSSLQAKIKELRKQGYNAFATSDQNGISTLNNYYLHELLNDQPAIPNNAPRSVKISMYYCGTWTWLEVERDGVKIVTDQAMSDLFGEDHKWKLIAHEKLGQSFYFSDKKQHKWAIRNLRVDPVKLAEVFDIAKIDVEITVLPEVSYGASEPVKTESAKSEPVKVAPAKAASVEDRLTALESGITTILSLLQKA